MPAWSPDGTWVVYVSEAGGEVNNTYVVTIADGAQSRLTEHDVRDYGPVWSADGRQILVVWRAARTLREGTLALHLMNADGSALRQLGADDVFTAT